MWHWAHRLEQGGLRLEDRLAVFPREHGLDLVVVDGAGGGGGGLEAAEKALEMARLAFSRGEGCVRCLAAIDEALWKDSACGEATAVLVRISEEGLQGASVGDSGAWWLSPAGDVELTAQQRRKPRLGTGYAEPVGFSRELSGPGILLAASDGLWPYCPLDKIRLLAQGEDLDGVLEQLVTSVRLPLSRELPDDLAMIVARYDKP